MIKKVLLIVGLFLLLVSVYWIWRGKVSESSVSTVIPVAAAQSPIAQNLTSSTESKNLLSGHIIFSSDRTGSNNLFLMDLVTGKVENLTNSSFDNFNPHISPDRKTIVFYSNRAGNNQIYALDLNSRNVIRLTNNFANEYDPSYSPDGKKIVFKSNLDDGYGDIWVMNADGSNRRNLTPRLNKTEEWIPVYNADGSQIYFVSGLEQNSEILVMDSRGDSRGVSRLTSNTVPDWFATLNPSNGNLVVTSRDTDLTNDALFYLSADGKSKSKLLSLPKDSNDASYSFNGERIVFINNQSGNYDIFVMNSEGTRVELVEKTDSSELSPIFID